MVEVLCSIDSFYGQTQGYLLIGYKGQLAQPSVTLPQTLPLHKSLICQPVVKAKVCDAQSTCQLESQHSPFAHASAFLKQV